MAENREQEKLINRWASDAGVAFYSEDGKETRYLDPKKEKKRLEKIREQMKSEAAIDEIDEV